MILLLNTETKQMCTVGSFPMSDMVEPGPGKSVLDVLDDEWMMASAEKVLNGNGPKEKKLIEEFDFKR